MEYIKWKEELSVGLDSIDTQHKELFRLINAFYNSIGDNLGRPAILQAIKDMGNYIVVHFTQEEAMMKRAGYINFEEHKKEHQYFIETVADFKKRYEEDGCYCRWKFRGLLRTGSPTTL